ncbi:hypothetical protein [Capillimicrobium parvum]|uniref:Uncharacterized protein n=1 Tax=Capillimicrobium parvum TaxID=2884022 RepID=A0A9E6XW08_9ACTN|nr:hypothetical protein [Capillimicrobium parvum]UGS34807.1 hypothetical protein DSM104329_01189 [Capillimicrobium parvum]
MALEFGVFVQVTMLDGRGEDPALQHDEILGDMAGLLAGADADAIAADPRLAAQPYDSAPPAAATN